MARTAGTRLTEDWQPSDKDVLAARALGLTPGQIKWIRDGFVDYWTSDNAVKPCKKDWGQTWRNWMRKEASAAKRAIKTESPITQTEIAAENLELWRVRLRGWQRSGFWPVFAGPKPNEPRNLIPRAILIEFGLLKEEGRPQVAARPSGTCNI